MAEMQITMQDITVDGVTVKNIVFAGQLDETNVDDEAKKIYDVIDAMTVPNLLLDFAELAYMNSKSIGYLTDWYSRAAAKNGRIVIARPRPNILDILRVVGITQIINVYDSVEEAKNEFAGGASAPSATPAPTVETAPTRPEAAPKPPPAAAAQATPAMPTQPAPQAPVTAPMSSAPSAVEPEKVEAPAMTGGEAEPTVPETPPAPTATSAPSMAEASVPQAAPATPASVPSVPTPMEMEKPATPQMPADTGTQPPTAA